MSPEQSVQFYVYRFLLSITARNYRGIVGNAADSDRRQSDKLTASLLKL